LRVARRVESRSEIKSAAGAEALQSIAAIHARLVGTGLAQAGVTSSTAARGWNQAEMFI